MNSAKICLNGIGIWATGLRSIIFMTMGTALNLPPAKISHANTPDDLYLAHQLLLEYQEDVSPLATDIGLCP